MNKSYPFSSIEKEEQKYYETEQPFKVDSYTSKSLAQNYYCLSMFPYPSGAELHMGHMRNYTLGDTITRIRIMQGHNVLQPMGWDAFGLPAHNAAIKNNMSPEEWTRANILKMKNSLKEMGFAYDWSKEICTCDPSYYRHQQWFFLQLFKKGLVYRKEAWVYYDPVDKTVLANEQVIDGKGWRSGIEVEKRKIHQWFIHSSVYANELYDSLEQMRGIWPDNLITIQKRWIGKSQGYHVHYTLTSAVSHIDSITVFTTKEDSLRTAQAVLIAPGHALARELSHIIPELDAFLQKAIVLSDKKAGKEWFDWNTDLKVIHPISKLEMSVWISSRVRSDYATESMHVSPESEMDQEFLQQHKIALQTHVGDMPNLEKATYHRLRDWGISRQRSWGCPIPVIYCQDCGILLEEDLPVLVNHAHAVDCPKCGKLAQREQDTMDTFVESSWYYARFICPDSDRFLDERIYNFLPVDCYIGGIEHANLHFLYARLFYRLMRDTGCLDVKRLQIQEPFYKVITQGMVLLDGHKMSKSRGNIVAPKKMVQHYGVDAVRLFMLMAAPPSKDFEFQEKGVLGTYRFLSKIYQFAMENMSCLSEENTKTQDHLDIAPECKELHQIALLFNSVLRDLELYKFNTAVSYAMKLFRELHTLNTQSARMSVFRDLLRVLHPLAPHLTSHLWRSISPHHILKEPYPKELIYSLESKVLLQINGKFAGMVRGKNISLESAELALKATDHYQQLSNFTLVKKVWVPGKIFNLVIKLCT